MGSGGAGPPGLPTRTENGSGPFSGSRKVPEVIRDTTPIPEEAQMASMKRDVLDNIPLLVVAAMAAMGLFSFFSVILG